MHAFLLVLIIRALFCRHHFHFLDHFSFRSLFSGTSFFAGNFMLHRDTHNYYSYQVSYLFCCTEFFHLFTFYLLKIVGATPLFLFDFFSTFSTNKSLYKISLVKGAPARSSSQLGPTPFLFIYTFISLLVLLHYFTYFVKNRRGPQPGLQANRGLCLHSSPN